MHYVDANGPARLSCGEVVMAGNALGNARLLTGIIDNPLFGCGLMLHPTAIVTGLFKHNQQKLAGAFASALVSQEFYESDESRGFIGGLQLQALRGQGPLTTALGEYYLSMISLNNNNGGGGKERDHREIVFAQRGGQRPLSA